jgi:hypothetical protein
MMSLLLFISLFTYPDSTRIIGSTRHPGGIGGDGTAGNQISVRDTRGWIHCVYSSGVGSPYGSGPSDICYVYSADNGLTWSTSMNLSGTDNLNSDKPNLVIDDRNVLHCVWRQFYEGTPTTRGEKLVYSCYENGLWTDPVIISREQIDGKGALYSSLVVDSLDRLHVVWDHQTGSGNWDIFYSYLNGDTWSIPYNISQDPYDSAFPSLAINKHGNLHLVYRTRIQNRPIMYTKYNGVSWTSPEVVSDTFYGGGATIVVDSQDNPHILFWGLYYTTKINNQWTYPQRIVNMGDTLYQYFDFAIDSCNNLYTVWQARIPSGSTYQEDIYYCTYNGTSWSNRINLTQDTTRSFTPKLGNPVHTSGVDLVWLNMPNDTISQFDIMYMRLNPVSAGIEEITTPHQVVMAPKLKVYPNPSKPLSVIHYTLPVGGNISLQLYDISGRLVKTLVNEQKKPGIYRINFSTKDLSAGVYFVTLQIETKRIIERLVVIK